MLKKKSLQFKKVALKSNKKGLNRYSSLQNKGSELNKQNEKAKAKWEKVRNQALERDNFKCIVCGKPATQVHHIYLRSKRRDLLYEINNLVSLCDKHHFHQSTDKYEEQTLLIARVKHMTIEELLKFAETKSEE